mgnify:CR=1 FL=1
MKKEEVYGHIDHTLLKAFSTTEQIEAIAEEALKYGGDLVHSGKLCKLHSQQI